MNTNKLLAAIKISVLALALSLGLSYAFAWTSPSATPPGGNIAAPLNMGTSPQTKNGDLTLERLFTIASSSIATTAQTQTLTVGGTIGATGDICTAVSGGKCLSTVAAGAIDPAPIGSIVSFAGTAAPAGYLLCDGSAVSRTAYAALFAVIGTTYGAGNGSTTFNLPDLRGEFIRGLDQGRGVDAGRTLGSWQVDLFKSHTHTITFYNPVPPSGGGSYGGFSTAGAQNSGATGGAETRPRNVALNYIIKAEQASVIATSTVNVVSSITAGSGITLNKVSPATGDVTVSAPSKSVDYSGAVGVPVNVVNTAPSDGYIDVILTGSYQNCVKLDVGRTNPPTLTIGVFGDDMNGNTKAQSAMFPIRSGDYYKLTQQTVGSCPGSMFEWPAMAFIPVN